MSRLIALLGLLIWAAPPAQAQTPPPEWQHEPIAQGPATCVPRSRVVGLDHDLNDHPVVGWQQDCGSGALPRVFWGRRVAGQWNVHEFLSDRRYQGGGDGDLGHTLMVMPLDGRPMFVYSAPGPYNEINTYRVDLDASLNGGPVSSYLENLAGSQSGGTAAYSLAAGPLAGAAAGPQWATGYYLSNDLGHVRINGTQISTSVVYRPRVAFAVTPDGGQHLLWSTQTQVFYTRKLPGDLLYRTESFLLGIERFGGEVRLTVDPAGVLHALVRGYDPDHSFDGGTLAYFRSTDQGQTWTGPEYVDPWDAVRSNPGVHTDISLAVDANGVPGVTYWKSREQLWFARRDGPAGTWTPSLVATRSNVGQPGTAPVDFDLAGSPVVAYWDQPTGQIMLATFRPPNQPPTISAALPAWQMFEGDSISLEMTRLVTASDPDGDELTYTVSGLPAGLTFDAAAGAVTGTVEGNSARDYTVSVQVSDPGGETAFATFRFSVTTRPALRSVTTLRISTGSTAPGAAIQLEVSVASESPTSQVPGGTVAIRVEPSRTLVGRVALDGSANASLRIAAPAYGAYSLIAAYEGSAAFLPSDATVPLSVIDPAMAPQIRPIADRRDAPGAFVEIAIEVNSPAHRGLTVTLSGAPADARYAEIEDRLIVAAPLTGASRGTHTVVVTVSDGLQSAVTSFVWTVEGNAPPVILLPAIPVVYPGDGVSMRLNIVDLDADPLRITVNQLPEGLTFDAATQTISGVIGTAYGLRPVYVVVTDGYWTLWETFSFNSGSILDFGLSADLSVAQTYAGDRQGRGVLTVVPQLLSRESFYGSQWVRLTYTVELPSGAMWQGVEPTTRFEGDAPPSCVPSGLFQLTCTHTVPVWASDQQYPLRLFLGIPASPDPLVYRVGVALNDRLIREPDLSNNIAQGTTTPTVSPATGRRAMLIVVEHNNEQLTSVSWSKLNTAATSAVTMELSDIGVPANVSDLVRSVAGGVYNTASGTLAATTRTLVNRMKSRVIDANVSSAGCYADMLASLAADPELATQHPIVAFNNRYGEDWVADCLRQMATPHYDRVETLTDAEATFVNFKATVERLHEEGYEIDLLLDIHGCGTPSTRNNLNCGPNPWLLFSDGPAYREGLVLGTGDDESALPTLQSINSFFNGSVRNADGTPAPAVPGYVRLNAVYMVSCWGSNENQMWLDMGAKASNGSEELNYMVIISPFTFLDQFTRNRATLDEAARRAYEDERVLFEGLPLSFTIDFSMVPGCAGCRYTADLGAVYARKMAMQLSQEWGTDTEQPVSPLESSRRVGIVAAPVSTLDDVIYVTDPASGARLAIVVPTAITSGGTMTLQTLMQGPPVDVHQGLGTPAVQFDLSTTAGLTGPTQVCFPYDARRFTDSSTLRLLHYENGVWEDRTSSHDLTNHVICGHVFSFSPFAVVEFVNRVPVANAGDDRSAQATTSGGALITLDAGNSSDADGDTLRFRWTWTGGSATGDVAGVTLPVGVHAITLTVTDQYGAVATDTLVVTVTGSAIDGNLRGEGQFESGGARYLFEFAVQRTSDGRREGRFRLKVIRRHAKTGMGAKDIFSSSEVTFVEFSESQEPGPGRRPVINAARFGGTGQWNGKPGYRFLVAVVDGKRHRRHADTVEVVIEDPDGRPVVQATGTPPGNTVRARGKAAWPEVSPR